MSVTTDFLPANEAKRRVPFLPYLLLSVVVLGTLTAFTIPGFVAPELEPGHRSPQSCVVRGGEMQAVSTGFFGGASRAVCLFPDGTTFNIIPHVEFVDLKSESERG